MTSKTLLAQLAAARAIVNGPELAALESERDTQQAIADRLTTAEKNLPLTGPQPLELSNARRRFKTARTAAAALMLVIAKKKSEVAHIERLLDSDNALVKARAAWATASGREVQAIKAIDTAQGQIDRLDAMRHEDETKRDAAQIAQRAAIQADMGLGARIEGSTTAASAAKSLSAAEARLDALDHARPDAVAALAHAEAALVLARSATQRAEKAIMQAHADAAGLAHAAALDAYREALTQYHGSMIAASGLPGDMIPVYDLDSQAAFDAVAERIKAAAEQGA